MKAWEFMSDRHFKQILVSEKEFDQDVLRLILLALFYKTKRLEEQVFALHSMAMEKGFISEKELNQLLDWSQCYLEEKDEQKYKQVQFLKDLGISFEEMVQFTLTGSFEKDEGSEC